MQNRSLFYDALLLTGTNLLLRAVGLAFQAYTASLMGAAGVGLLQLIVTVGMLAGTVGSSGVRVAAMVLSAQEFGRRRLQGVRSAMRCCLCYGLIISTVAAMRFPKSRLEDGSSIMRILACCAIALAIKTS